MCVHDTFTNVFILTLFLWSFTIVTNHAQSCTITPPPPPLSRPSLPPPLSRPSLPPSLSPPSPSLPVCSMLSHTVPSAGRGSGWRSTSLLWRATSESSARTTPSAGDHLARERERQKERQESTGLVQSHCVSVHCVSSPCSQYYETHAFLRDEEVVSPLQQLLAGLSQINFNM